MPPTSQGGSCETNGGTAVWRYNPAMARHRLVVVLVDDVLPMDMAIPMHVFAREVPEAYDVATASLDGKPVPVAGGMTVVPDGGLDLVRRAKTVIVPGYAGAADHHVSGATARALGVAARRGTRMISICSGAFALAQAGILDGLTATTHWSLCHALAAQHPRVTVKPAVLFVDNGTVLTSGGVTAGVDLCLHVLAKDLGPSAARHVSRRLVMAPRRDGDQRQFMETTPVPPADDTIAGAQQWMLAVLAEPLTVAQMARHVHMSERSFHRRFTDRTGTSPLAWLREQRIARAKELLENSTLPVEHIASRVGLGTPANLRVHFRRATSLSPQEHRRQFSFASNTRPTTQDLLPHDPAATVRARSRP
jgi:transcriptional regulator GlxA family with amidase domain